MLALEPKCLVKIHKKMNTIKLKKLRLEILILPNNSLVVDFAADFLSISIPSSSLHFHSILPYFMQNEQTILLNIWEKGILLFILHILIYYKERKSKCHTVQQKGVWHMEFFSKSITRFYKWFLALWLVIFGVLGYYALDLSSKLHGDGFEMNGEYKHVEAELTKKFDFPKSTLLLVFEKQNHQTQQDFNKNIKQTLKEMNQLKITTGIQSPLKDQTLQKEGVAYAILKFDKKTKDMADNVKKVKQVIHNKTGTVVTGEPVLNQDINKASQDDLKRAELIGLPVALFILLLAFGSLIASIVPIIIGGFTVITSFGILTLLGDSLNLSIFILNIVPMIGLALSIDFALLFINRYREELQYGDKQAAIQKTIQTAGKSIIFSALCVFIGLAAMMVIQIDIFQTIAVGGMVVVATAVVSALTLLPSILLLLGNGINRLMIFKPKAHKDSFWKKFATKVMKRSVIIAILALTVLLIGIIPVKNMVLSIPGADSLPKDYQSRTAFEKIQKTFHTDKESVVYVLAKRDEGWTSPEGLEKMNKLTRSFEHDHLVKNVDSVFSISKITDSKQLDLALQNPQTKATLQPVLDGFVRGKELLIPVHLDAKDTSEKAKTWIRNWGGKDTNVSLQFGGRVKFNQEIYDEIYDKVGICVAIILLSTYFILMVAFKSIIIPLKAILMNIIGLASTFGILVWIFQGGHFGIPESDIALVLPILVFSLVFGLSMDYEVFLISRIYEMYKITIDNDEATVEGLSLTGKIITSAALIMIVITGAFAFTGVMPVKQIGIGIAIAILIDATIIRMLLVPSLMKLLGDWNWWMPFVRSVKQKRAVK